MGGEFFRAAPKLQLVQLLSAGYDHVDVEAARKAKVPVSNNGGANATAVAEHTLMLILAVLEAAGALPHRRGGGASWRAWTSSRPAVLRAVGATFGIIGLGNIGKKVARRVAAFDARGRQYYDIRAPHRARRRTPSACASCCWTSCCAARTW